MHDGHVLVILVLKDTVGRSKKYYDIKLTWYMKNK